ncbi:hypothetical protein IV203_008335 [Nitzschia inconspicua]|uniref:Uncharacterized protein n=1 Tax=Nitzschia inconspicua TaxID=303405 RepID=A0A9K3PLY0_9STRA|nr:hypothetical protein IV203_008335 [Nitzschia inconspicua]
MVHTGGRHCKWAQPHHISDLQHTLELNVRGTPAAFCLDDITLFRPGKRLLTFDMALAHPHLPTMVTACYRVQKNGAHGETLLFTQNTHDPNLSPVRHGLSIVQLFVHLTCRDKYVALAIYKDTTSHCDIEQQIRLLASELYGLDPLRWPFFCILPSGWCMLRPPSPWVRGTRNRETPCWKSKTWQLYTHNLCVISQKHNKAFFDASTMPQF